MFENSMITLSLLSQQKFDFSVLAENCHQLERMMVQKTAGQKKENRKDIGFENLFRIKANIICEAMALVREIEKINEERDA